MGLFSKFKKAWFAPMSFEELGEEFYQQLADMLVFDAVIINEDRHYGNFGLLRDNRSGSIISPAPVFDNGLSLLCYAMRDDFDKLEGKKLSQEMLMGYLNKSLKPIVIASKNKIQGDGYIDELVDYFRSGITIQLDDPTKEEKLEHFVALLTLNELEIEKEALLWIKNQEFISYTAAQGYLRTLRVVSEQSPITYEVCVANASNYII